MEGTYLGVFRAVLLLVAVAADGVIVEAGVLDQSDPLAPPRRNVAAVVLVEVLAEEACKGGTRREGGVCLVRDGNLATDAFLIFFCALTLLQRKSPSQPLSFCVLENRTHARHSLACRSTVPAHPRNGIIAD